MVDHPYVLDPKPLADSLVMFLEDEPTDLSSLAVAVRAALFECAEESAVASHCLDLTKNTLTQGLMLGRIEMANKVIRRIHEVLGGPKPLSAKPGEDTSK